MAREHANITMTAEEIGAFIADQSMCVLATLDDDGTPWGDAVACSAHGDALCFRVPVGTRTLHNLRSDARVCCTLESKGDDYYSVRAVMVHGEAVPLAESDLPAGLDELADPVSHDAIADAVTFRVALDDVVSFDFGKIQRRFEQ